MQTLWLLALLAAAPVLPFPPGRAEPVSLNPWALAPPPKAQPRSQQLPLTADELVKLAKAGADAAQLVKMLEDRRCACDASAEGLSKLKAQGVPKEVLLAVSLHGIKPNRALNLTLALNVTGGGTLAQAGYLHLFIDDGNLTRAFTVDLGQLPAARRGGVLFGKLPLKHHGKHTLLVAASANPTVSHPSQLTPQEWAQAQSYLFEYPRTSLENGCRLDAGYRREAGPADRWRFVGSRFDCEWN